MPQGKPNITTSEKSEALPITSTPSSSKADATILNQETNMMSNLGVFDPLEEKQGT